MILRINVDKRLERFFFQSWLWGHSNVTPVLLFYVKLDMYHWRIFPILPKNYSKLSTSPNLDSMPQNFIKVSSFVGNMFPLRTLNVSTSIAKKIFQLIIAHWIISKKLKRDGKSCCWWVFFWLMRRLKNTKDEFSTLKFSIFSSSCQRRGWNFAKTIIKWN